jgi:hypothetical protein
VKWSGTIDDAASAPRFATDVISAATQVPVGQWTLGVAALVGCCWAESPTAKARPITDAMAAQDNIPLSVAHAPAAGTSAAVPQVTLARLALASVVFPFQLFHPKHRQRQRAGPGDESCPDRPFESIFSRPLFCWCVCPLARSRSLEAPPVFVIGFTFTP